MTRTDWIQRIGNEWAFVRYMPVAKLARRARLDIKRRLRDRIGTPPDRTPAPPVADRPPLPLFGPRRGLCERAASGQLAFTFLNRRIVMPGAVIDWTAPSAASADQLWRMNLHYMEYLEATDDAALSQLIPDWIAANPAGRRGVWRDAWNSYALSIRVVVWMQQLAARGGRIDDDIRAIVHASLGAQLRFLERNLETDLGGNHLIKNVKALLWASAYVVGPEAARWRRLGLDLLQREIAAQILADGMHYERSPSYHCQVFADLLECRHVLGGQGIKTPGLRGPRLI